jgi:Rap guanine nucleotide exchange factor 1
MIWWSADQCESKCPNIKEMTNHFNRVSYWMRSKVMESDERKEREKRFNKFLKVAKVTLINVIHNKRINSVHI